MRALDGESDDFSEADEQHIRELLAAQPRPAMPAPVADRIQAALAQEPRPVAAPPRSRSRLGWGLAAAAAVAVLAGVIVVPQLRQQSAPVADTTSSATPPAAPTPADPIPPAAAAESISVDCVDKPLTYDTGTSYQQVALTTQAQALVPQECGGSAQYETRTGESADGTATARPWAQRSMKCIVRVAPTTQVMLIDRGTYEGVPAIVAVVGPPTRALAVDCARQPAQVLMDVALP